MPQREEKHNKTKKKPPKSPTKKETLLEASCIAKKSFYDNPIMSEKAQQKAPEASVQQGFHCSCFARNENLVISYSFLFKNIFFVKIVYRVFSCPKKESKMNEKKYSPINCNHN